MPPEPSGWKPDPQGEEEFEGRVRMRPRATFSHSPRQPLPTHPVTGLFVPGVRPTAPVLRPTISASVKIVPVRRPSVRGEAPAIPIKAPTIPVTRPSVPEARPGVPVTRPTPIMPKSVQL